MVIRRVDSSMLVRGASSICLSPEAQKKNRSMADLGACAGNSRVTRGHVQCNMLADRGANKSDGWGLGSSAAEWSMTSWRETDATGSRDAECAPKGSVVRTYSEGVVGVVRVRRPTGGTKSRGEECAPKSSVVGVVRRCRPCGTCPATNRSGPCHLTAVVVAVVGGRALPPLRSHPRRNRDCGLDENQKQKNRYEKEYRKG